MENYDPEMAARVWQRVRPAGMDEDPVSLISRVQRNGLRYNALSHKTAVKLAEAKRSQADCLQGICIMQSGERAQVRTAKPENTSQRTMLCRCLAEELALLSEYEQRSDEAHFGAVYQQLAQEQRHHCAMAAQLLGKLSRSDGSLPRR